MLMVSHNGARNLIRYCIAATVTTLTVYCVLDTNSSTEGHAKHIREPVAECIGRTAAHADTEEAVQVGQARWPETSGRDHPHRRNTECVVRRSESLQQWN